MRVLNDGSTFEASIERTFFFILTANAIDEAHVETGERPCHGWIELRTTHRDLLESQRTITTDCNRPISDRMRPNPIRSIQTSHEEFG